MSGAGSHGAEAASDHGDVERVARGLDGVGQAVIGTDLDGRILFWSADAETLYGWTAAEVLGSDVVQITPSELSQAEGARIMDTLRGGETWSGRFIVRDKLGRRFLAEVTDVPVRDERGELIGIVGVSERIEYIRS